MHVSFDFVYWTISHFQSKTIYYLLCLYAMYLLSYCEFWISLTGARKIFKICLFVNLIFTLMNSSYLHVYDKWCLCNRYISNAVYNKHIIIQGQNDIRFILEFITTFDLFAIVSFVCNFKLLDKCKTGYLIFWIYFTLLKIILDIEVQTN